MSHDYSFKMAANGITNLSITVALVSCCISVLRSSSSAQPVKSGRGFRTVGTGPDLLPSFNCTTANPQRQWRHRSPDPEATYDRLQLTVTRGHRSMTNCRNRLRNAASVTDDEMDTIWQAVIRQRCKWRQTISAVEIDTEKHRREQTIQKILHSREGETSANEDQKWKL